MKHLKKYEVRDTTIGMGDYVYNTQGLDKLSYDKILSYINGAPINVNGSKVSKEHSDEMDFYLVKRFPEETKKKIQKYVEKNNITTRSVDDIYKIRFAKAYLKVIDWWDGFVNLDIELSEDDKQIIEDVKMEMEANKYNI